MSNSPIFVKAYSAPQPKTKHEIMKAEKNAMISIAKEEEKKLAKMSLADLKEMACIKATQHNKDWYMTCVSCPGENGCSIGRRVIEILESETKPEERKTQIQKFNERGSKSDKEQFIEALKHKDIYDYIMETYKLTRHSAYNKVYKWRNRYPGIAHREFNPVFATNVLANGERVKKTRNTVVEAFTYPDGVFAYFNNVLKVSDRSVIRGRVINWANTYKDLNEQYHISEWAESTRGKPGRRPKNADAKPLTSEEPKVKTVITRTEDDEVSISDFLNEMEEKPVVSATVINPVPAANVKDALENVVAIDAASMHPTSITPNASFHEDIQKQEQKNSVCSALSEKRKQICQRIDNLYEMIKQYNDEIEEWKKKLEAFDTVAIEMGFAKEF